MTSTARHSPTVQMNVRSMALLTSLALAAALAGCAAGAGSADSGNASKTRDSVAVARADSFHVTFETSRGTFVVAVTRAWAPLGADRFRELVAAHFFDDDRFFRVIPGFVAQFGINDKPKVNERWDKLRISDDSVRQTNARGTLVFATEGPNTRSHQFFINLVDNARLDGMGFAPIGRVIQGMDVVDSLYSGYGDDPDQGMIQSLGNSYLARMYPKLDYVKRATVSKTN